MVKLKLKLQYFGYLMRTADLLENHLILGDRRLKEKRMTEDDMVAWHHIFNGHEFGQTLEDGVGHGSLACCSSWGRKKSDMSW